MACIMSRSFDFAQAPGHLIRRAQQIAVAEFARVLVDYDITPVQFALLNAVIDAPGLDQITLAKTVAFDPATSGSVIGRLEAKGWLQRQADVQDRRRKLLLVTPEGAKAVAKMSLAVSQVQKNILAPLSAAQQLQFMDLLAKLVSGHEHPENTPGQA